MVLNWNGERYLRPCLGSVVQDACRHVEVVLIDNGSTDDSVSVSLRQFPSVRVIALPKNLGYSGGYNAAIDQMSGRFLVFLNNDTVVQSEWLEPLIEELIRDHKIGLTTSKLLIMGTRTVHTLGGKLKLWQGAMELGLGRDETFFSGTRTLEPFFACGAAMAMRKELFQKLGGFDRQLPLYCEDLDLSWRARLAGYSVVGLTQSVVLHHLSGTSGVLTPIKVRFVTSHHTAVMIKCLSVPHLLHSLPAYTVFALVKGTALAIAERNPAYFASVVMAFVDVVKAARDIWQRRRTTQLHRVAPDWQVLKSSGFGLFESPVGLFRQFRLVRRMNAQAAAAATDSGESSASATAGS